jgi:UDPglucose--hexose-1-phosphate uridylyltransferase
MTPNELQTEIERLLRFALKSGLIEQEDVIVARNALLDLFRLPEPAAEAFIGDVPDSPVPVLERMLDYAAEHGLIPDNTTTQRDLLDARIMGLLMPRQSEIVRRFRQLLRDESPQAATAYYYALSQASNYIRMDRIAKNLYWRTATDYGELEITVNLSKPEKDPQEIAAERNAPKAGYPKCLLCPENAGYAGRINHPARQNHRIIPVSLDGSAWYLQYSPYVYYNEHCIVFNESHTPMAINRSTFVKLLDFVEQFPHYFIGSNADLPIVGGSILSHDHFQGGRHVFPMERAPIERTYVFADEPGVRAGTVKWPMSVVRLAGRDKEALIRLADALLAQWREYSDPEAEVLAYTEGDGGRTPHNTITPIARKNQDGEFELDLVLRNNRTSAEHPDGIFHPHRELHHIKKENIGLIEVMGLAVLPGRLENELQQIAELLTGQCAYQPDAWEEGHPLRKHIPWIERMRRRYGVGLKAEETRALLQDEVGRLFLQVLADAGVFKRTEAGQAAFHRFMTHIGFRG